MSGAELKALLARACRQPAAPSSDFELTADVVEIPDPTAAGVLAAFRPDGRMILTRRASGLRHHAGQIAFPGGKVDPGDDGVIGAALREAHEEVGLPPQQVEVLGCLAPHLTVTGYLMTPVIGLIHGDYQPVAEAGEVAEVFEVPIAHLADPANYRIEKRLWRDDWRPYRVAPWGPYYIWGATARVLYGLAMKLSAERG